MKNNFTHLHVHTPDSLLDGFNKIDNLIDKVKQLEMDAVAITDHGTLAGTYEFQHKCLENNIKPLLGIEMYHTHDMEKITLPVETRKTMALKEALENGVEIPEKAKKKEIEELTKPYMYDTKGYHLILIAKNQTGWDNLIKISSIANENGMFNGRGHCDNELLKKYSEGIICTSACIGSMINQYILKDQIEEAYAETVKLKTIFGDDFYLELQPLNDHQQLVVNRNLINFANELEIKLIASNDSHYTNKEDAYVHDVLLCIGTGKTYNDPDRMRYNQEFWIRSYHEMKEAFLTQIDAHFSGYEMCMSADEYFNICVEALDNTQLIVDKVSSDIQLGADHELLPNVPVPKGYTPETWISQQCWIKLYKYLKKENIMDKKDIYEARLKHELNIINTKGFASYFLIVQDAIQNSGCPFGPGRGSAAGSLVSFLLGIVKGTDPIEYDLLFSRFLTMDRVAMPDIDSDVSQIDRQNLIKYLDNTYGHENVCQVGTKTTLSIINGIKDVMRVFEIPFAESNNLTKELAKLIDSPSLTFAMFDALEESDFLAFRRFKELERQYKECFEIARALEGIPRNYGIHAGGVLITPVPINDIFPTRFIDGKKVTVWDKDIVEKAGGVKFDMLGLKTVSVISETLKLISQHEGIDITLDELYENKSIRYDENVFDMLKKKQSDTVFQMESDLFKGLISDIEPDNIDDLIAITSIARPGPLSAGFNKTYAKRKRGTEEIVYDLGCDDILGNTYGCMLYQEQLMLIAKKVAGFDDNQADTYLRKSVAKKKKALMDLCKEWFIHGKPEQDKYGQPIVGGIANGFDEQSLEQFWEDVVEGCAAYLFNKSHATSYSLLSCITAWLKYYYPCEYFTAVLTLLGDESKREGYISVLENSGISVLVPDINKSLAGFTCDPEQYEILFGLQSVKGVGEKPIQAIINNRPYSSLEDFYSKVTKSNVNKTAGKALIKAGAFDSLYDNPNRYELLNEFFDIRRDRDDRYNVEDYNPVQCIGLEKEVLSISLTYKEWTNDLQEGDKIKYLFKINSIIEKTDKNGNLMAFMTLERNNVEIEMTVFSRDYVNNLDKLFVGNELELKGKVGVYKGKKNLVYCNR